MENPLELLWWLALPLYLLSASFVGYKWGEFAEDYANMIRWGAPYMMGAAAGLFLIGAITSFASQTVGMWFVFAAGVVVACLAVPGATAMAMLVGGKWTKYLLRKK